MLFIRSPIQFLKYLNMPQCLDHIHSQLGLKVGQPCAKASDVWLKVQLRVVYKEARGYVYRQWKLLNAPEKSADQHHPLLWDPVRGIFE